MSKAHYSVSSVRDNSAQQPNTNVRIAALLIAMNTEAFARAVQSLRDAARASHSTHAIHFRCIDSEAAYILSPHQSTKPEAKKQQCIREVTSLKLPRKSS